MQIHPDTAAAKAAKAMEVGGASATGLPLAQKYVFGLTPDEWSVLFGALGFLVALIGLGLSWYYKRQHLKLAVATRRADPEE